MPTFETSVFISCEHADFLIPHEYQELFRKANKVIRGHRGYDIGAAGLARYLSQKTGAELLLATYSRLLIDLNRSEHHNNLFSEYTAVLPGSNKQDILDDYYHPYRNLVLHKIRQMSRHTSVVLHLSVHSFTPELNGVKRNTDIGLLYDPGRQQEKKLCVKWQQKISDLSDEFRVRRNYPYKGSADGLTTALRRQFSAKKYIGIELEVNQKLLQPGTGHKMDKLFQVLFSSLVQTIESMPSVA